MFKKVIKYFYRFLQFFFLFNPVIAVKLFILPVLYRNIPAYDRFAYKHKTIKNYLKRKFKKIINSFKEKQNDVDPSFAENFPVWFLWWQGENEMPPIVKICYRTLQKNSNGHQVNLVTKNNFSSFISIPDYIQKKINRKKISITHFSDILRLCLLYEHGGLWLDSTVLTTKPLESLPEICSHLGFWTPKDDGSIITTCFGANNWIVREGKWLTFCFYSSKNNLLVDFVRSLFFSYMKRYRIMIDYFLFDYLISIGYDSLTEIRLMIDSVPLNNTKVHEIYHRLKPDYEYNKALFDEVCRNTFFHKLNWKDEYKIHTKNGKLTNYGHILNNYP